MNDSLKRLQQGLHHDPFELLGRHPHVDGGWIIRALLPSAESASVTGGGAMLRDLDKLLMEETGLPVVIADDPMTCVARGGGRVIELIDEHGPAVFGLE